MHGYDFSTLCKLMITSSRQKIVFRGNQIYANNYKTNKYNTNVLSEQIIKPFLWYLKTNKKSKNPALMQDFDLNSKYTLCLKGSVIQY